MNDGSVLFIDLAGGSVLKEVTGIPVARGVVVADDVGVVFVTSQRRRRKFGSDGVRHESAWHGPCRP
jgi:hypothetical protein